jgi:hypothetical protein
MIGHIYLIQEREFLRQQAPVYKIGKSTNIRRRTADYPKGSHIIGFLAVSDVDTAEMVAIKLFKEGFRQELQYGTEYFYGDPNAMINLLLCVSSRFPTDSSDLEQQMVNLDPAKSVLPKPPLTKRSPKKRFVAAKSPKQAVAVPVAKQKKRSRSCQVSKPRHVTRRRTQTNHFAQTCVDEHGDVEMEICSEVYGMVVSNIR